MWMFRSLTLVFSVSYLFMQDGSSRYIRGRFYKITFALVKCTLVMKLEVGTIYVAFFIHIFDTPDLKHGNDQREWHYWRVYWHLLRHSDLERALTEKELEGDYDRGSPWKKEEKIAVTLAHLSLLIQYLLVGSERWFGNQPLDHSPSLTRGSLPSPCLSASSVQWKRSMYSLFVFIPNRSISEERGF